MQRFMRSLLGLAFMVLAGNAAAAAPAAKAGSDVVKMALAKGVSLDDAVEAMKIRANNLNMKLVAEMPLSKQLQAMGEKSRRIDIFQFCDPLSAKKMVEASVDFAAYLPCRIALVEDKDGKGWLVMANLDPLIASPALNAKLREDAKKVRDTLLEIMQAGAKGEW